MKIKTYVIIAAAAFLAALPLACANQGAPGGGPEDKEPPEVDISYPEHGEVNVNPRSPVVIEFSEWINTGVSSAVSMYPPPPGGVTVKAAKNKITIKPKEPFAGNTTYQVIVSTALKDLRGNSPEAPINIVFSTGAELDSGRLDGVIVPFGKLTAMPRVALYREDGKWDNARYFASPDYAAHSDSAGTYSFSHLREGKYRVAAFVDQYRVGRMHHGDTCFTSAEKTVTVTKAAQTVRLYPSAADTTIAGPDSADKSETPDTAGLSLTGHTPTGTISLMPELRLLWSKPARVAVSAVTSVAEIDTVTSDSVVFFRALGGELSDTTLFAPARRLRPGLTYNFILSAQDVTDKDGNHARPKAAAGKARPKAVKDTATASDTISANGNDSAAAAVDTAAADSVKAPMIEIALRTVSADSLCYRLHGGAECLGENSKRKWVYAPFGWKEKFFAQDKSGMFTYDSIPASKGLLHWFVDDNNDNQITPGKLAPWRAPERFFMVPDTVEAKARWEVEDMRIKAGCE